MSYLEANLEALATVQPMLAEELRLHPTARHIELMPLADEIPTLDAIIVVGLPSWESLLSILGSRIPVVILSHDALPEIRTYLTLLDIRQAILSGRISFAVGEDGVLQVLNDIFGTLYRRRITLFGRTGSDSHGRALKELQFFDTLCSSNRATLDQFAEEWQNNVSDNLQDFLSGPFLEDQAGRWSGGEAVVVAAGPSLDEVDIPAAFKGAPVVACDTAVPVLGMRGVAPDLIVTLDSSVSNQAYLQNLPEEIYQRSILCATPLVSRRVYQRFSNVLFYSYGHPTLDRLRAQGLPFQPLASGGSVALTSVDITRLLGARRVYLLGFDFQFYPFRTHARGTGAALRAVRSSSRLLPVELFVYEYQNELEATPTGEHARAALMDRKFQKWREWLELYVRNNDIELFQMSRNTAPIAGVRPGKPEGGGGYSRPNLRRRPILPDVERDMKFLLKELDIALTVSPEDIPRQVSGLPRVNQSLGYVLAWLSDKPASESREKLRAILLRYRTGVQAALGGQGR